MARLKARLIKKRMKKSHRGPSHRGPSLDINKIASGKYDVRQAIQGDAQALEVVEAAVENARRQGSLLELSIKQQRSIADKLRTKLSDMATFSSALGVALSATADSAEAIPIEEISLKPIFDTGSILSVLSKHIESERLLLQQAELYKSCISHMLDRGRNDQLREDKRQRSRETSLRLEKQKFEELNRAHLRTQQSLRHARAKLAKVQREGSDTLASWHEEIAARHAHRLERRHNARMLQDQIERREGMIEKVANLDDKELNDMKQRKQQLEQKQNRTHQNSGFDSQLEQTLREEQRFEHVFRLVGVKLGKMNPTSIIATCLSQSNTARGLEKQLSELERDVTTLKETLEKENDSYNATLYSGDKNNIVEIAERIEIASNLEKQVKSRKLENIRAQDLLEPMQFGIFDLATRVLGKAPAKLIDDDLLVATTKQIGEALVAIKAKEKARSMSSMFADTVKQSTAVVGGVVEVPGVTIVPDNWRNADSILSPYNVRLPVRESTAIEEAGANSQTSTLAERRAQNRAAAVDNAQHLQMEKNVKSLTLTALSIKAISKKIVLAATTEKKKKSAIKSAKRITIPNGTKR